MRPLPGDLSAPEKISRMIRVNHAGEYGAMRIYAGQLSVLSQTDCAPVLQHMQVQEEAHLAYFQDQLVTRQVRPTVLSPLWHVAGFALGAATALLGKKAAMACTVAVEDAIDDHYSEQLKELQDVPEEESLKNHIEQFRQEELEHRDIGLQEGAEKAPGYSVLYGAIKQLSKTAIWLSTRI